MSEYKTGTMHRAPIHQKTNNTKQHDLSNQSSVDESLEESDEYSQHDESLAAPLPVRQRFVKQQELDKSRSVPRTPERPARRPIVDKHAELYDLENERVNGKSNLKFYIIIFVVILLGIICRWRFACNEKVCVFDKIKQKYPSQDDYLWDSLSTHIGNILNAKSHSPGVYLFVHESTNSVQYLIEHIVKQTTQCFGQPMKYVALKANEFNGVDDYGTIIERYKERIQHGNVVLVVDLNAIPAEAARALHAICDTESPIKKDVVIFLTLQAPSIEGNIKSIAENELNSLWGAQLERNELDPLITRVTDLVIALRN